MSRSQGQKLSRWGMWFGGAWALVQWLWRRIGDVETARSVFEDRTMIAEWLSSQYAGPVISVVCLIAYLYFELTPTDAKRDEPEEPPDAAPSQSSTLGDLGRIGTTVTFPKPEHPQPAPNIGNDTQPVVTLRWRSGNAADTRVEYQDWSDVAFIVHSPRKERVRAFIEHVTFLDPKPNRTKAHFAGPQWHVHEYGDLPPEGTIRDSRFLTLA